MNDDLDEALPMIHALIDDFQQSVWTRDSALVERLWGSGGFLLVGSEADEVFRTHAELAAKFATIFSLPARLLLDCPARTVTVSGSVAWVFLEGTLSRVHPDGRVDRTVYLASCIFQREGGIWRWRQFFGSEPS